MNFILGHFLGRTKIPVTECACPGLPLAIPLPPQQYFLDLAMHVNSMCVCINSWNVGNAHFVIFSTEVYFFTEYGVES